MAARTEAPKTQQAALSRLIATSVEEFATKHWGRQPVLTPAADLPQGFTDLLDADAVDELVSERGLRTPFLRVARNGSTLGDSAFTAPGGVGATIGDQVSDDKLLRLFAEGATLVLQALHRVWPPVIAFCQQLAGDLGHPVQANAYVTPPQNQGFRNHYDVHDVFVLQISGQKRWMIHEPVHPAPLRHQPWTDHRRSVERRSAEPPIIDAVLSPGDCLYLPRGFLHAATALGGVSTHLTIGIHSWTRYAAADLLLQQALRTAAADLEFRAALPLGVDVTDPGQIGDDVATVKRALIEAIQAVGADTLAAAWAPGARSTQRAAPLGPLRQLRTVADLDQTTVLRVRPHLDATITSRPDGGLDVASRAGTVTIAPSDQDAFRHWWRSGEAVAGDLGVPLATSLLLAGLAVAE